MARLACPYCDFTFKVLIVNGPIPDLAPVVCGDCARVGLMERGVMRPVNALELAALKLAPVWKEMIEPVIRQIRLNKVREMARNN